ncbi:MAG TPA: hypothetical protein DEO59_14625, partial [Balneola sp.]|nr:hypothetical protein [Balneola sp.]
MHISKKNEVYLQLTDVEPSIAAELNSFFTFEVPNAKFMPAVRNRVWDGKIRLFSPATGEIYVGLLEYIKKYCDKHNISYILEKGVEDERVVASEVVNGFVRSLKLKSKGKSLKVRDYQIQAVQHAISRNRALLLSPTASGKSLIIYSLIRYYHLMGLKTLILVPTTSLVEQMYTDFEDYGWSSGTYCQKIYQGYDRKVTKDVVISTWQSIYKMPKKYFEQFGCVIGDEAHTFKAKSLTRIMTKLHQCKYRFGFTGTLDDTETHKLVLEGLFGAVEKVVTTKELMDKKTLANLKIKCIALKHPEIKKRMSYAEEIDYLAKLNPPRYLTVSHEDDEVGEQLSTVFLRLAKEYVSHTLGEDKVFTVDIESLYVTRVFSETFDEWQQPTSKPWYSGLTCLFYLKVPPQIESNDDSNEGWSHLRWGSDIEYDDNVLRPSNEEF